MEQDQWHFNLADLFEKEKIVNETGCKVPCSFIKYELASEVKYISNKEVEDKTPYLGCL